MKEKEKRDSYVPIERFIFHRVTHTQKKGWSQGKLVQRLVTGCIHNVPFLPGRYSRGLQGLLKELKIDCDQKAKDLGEAALVAFKSTFSKQENTP